MSVRADEGARLGSLFGFPIYAHASLIAASPLLFILLLMSGMGDTSLLDGLAFVAIVAASVIAHELGHAFTARALGVPVRQIALTWYGGYAEFYMRPATRGSEILIALTGPLTNLVIGATALLYLINTPDPHHYLGSHTFYERYTFGEFVMHAVRSTAMANLSLGAFNLLPGLPLDGGQILRSVLNFRMSRGRAAWIAAWAGFFVGLATVAAGSIAGSLWTVVIGISLAITAWRYRRRLRYE